MAHLPLTEPFCWECGCEDWKDAYHALGCQLGASTAAMEAGWIEAKEEEEKVKRDDFAWLRQVNRQLALILPRLDAADRDHLAVAIARIDVILSPFHGAPDADERHAWMQEELQRDGAGQE